MGTYWQTDKWGGGGGGATCKMMEGTEDEEETYESSEIRCRIWIANLENRQKCIHTARENSGVESG